MTSKAHSSAVTGLVELGLKTVSGELQASAFDVHGVKTRLVTDSTTVVRAVAGLLRAFAAKDTGEPDIEVHLFTVNALEDDMAPVAADASILYDWGMVKVYHAEVLRYLTVDSRARVTADVGQCRAAGFIENSYLDSEWLIAHLIFYPLWGQLLKERGLFPLHAAGLVKNGNAILIPGRSGSGKSTLSLQLVKAGYGLLSDDTVLLRQKGGKVEAMSFPEEINVSEQTVELFPELSRVKNFTVNKLRQKSSFSIEELYPDSIVDSSMPALLIFPQIAEVESTRVEPMSKTEALTLGMRYGFFFLDPSTTGRHFEILSLLAKQARCYRLHSGRDQENLKQVVDGLFTDTVAAAKSFDEEKK